MGKQEQNSQRLIEPEAAQKLKTNILTRWRGLPPHEQATLLFEMVHDVLASDVGQSVRRELGIASGEETVNPDDQPIPTNWVAKEDLVYCRPDLAEQIKALDESEVTHIADKIGDALQDTYWLAMGIILDEYLGSEDTDDKDDEEEAL